MSCSTDYSKLFFSDLRSYNNRNFRAIQNADLSVEDPVVHKAFSSVVTRYFIFKEKHPEVSEVDCNILYYKLKLDLVARYFAEYPHTTTDNLIAFQLELRNFINENKEERQELSQGEEQSSPAEEVNSDGIERIAV